MSADGRTTPGKRTLSGPESGPRRGALAAAASALLLSAVWLALFGLGGPQHLRSVFAIPAVEPGASATNSPTDTPVVPTATPQPGSIQIVSPASHRGPAGMHVTISGNNFPNGQVPVFASTSPSCSDQPAVLGSVSANGNGFSNAVVDWPASLAPGQYYICAQGVMNAPGFTDMSQTPPGIVLTPTTALAGQPVTITGSNFYGVPAVDFSLQTGGVITQLPTLVGNPDANGSFTLQFTPTAAMAGNQTLVASSPAENGAPTSPIQVKVTLLIQSAATQTVVAPTTSPTGPTPNSSGHSNSSLIVVIIVGIVLVVLAILGLVAFLLLRGRGGPGGPGGGYPQGPGYGEPGSPYGAPYGQSSPGMYAGSGAFPRPGAMDLPETYAGPAIGGVSQWDDTTDIPRDDWQPRPMSGNRRDMDDSLYGVYPEGGEPYPGPRANSGPGYPPPDPWANDDNSRGFGPRDGYGGSGAGPRATYGGGQTRTGRPSGAQPSPYGGSGRDTGRTGAARQDDGWGNDGGWDDDPRGGPGATRPGGGAPGW